MPDETKQNEVAVVEEVPAAVVVASGIFGDDPVQALERARQLVAATDALIAARRGDFIVNVQGKQYPKVDWWTAMGQPLGLSPQTEWVRRREDFEAETWEARVIVTNRTGTVISAGQAICSAAEPRWGKADTYARYSMAQTRAVGKAYRQPLSFLAVLSGLQPTPADEVPAEGFDPDADHDALRAEAAARKAASAREKAVKAFFAAFDPIWLAAAPTAGKDDADLRDAVRHALIAQASEGKWHHVRDAEPAWLVELGKSLKGSHEKWAAWVRDGKWLELVRPESEQAKCRRAWAQARLHTDGQA
jgi:hypothetical protein